MRPAWQETDQRQFLELFLGYLCYMIYFAIKSLCLWPAVAYPCLLKPMFHPMLEAMLELMWQIMWVDFCPEGMLETKLELTSPTAQQQRKEGNENPGA